MSLHTFETDATLPTRQYDAVVNYFSQIRGNAPREYTSLVPTFHTGYAAHRLGEIAFTHATDAEFAGVLFVSDSNRDERSYDAVLLDGGVANINDIPICSFTSHLIAGKRMGDSVTDFSTVSVVRDTVQGRNQIRAERKFTELIRASHITEFQIKPRSIYSLARTLKPKTRS